MTRLIRWFYALEYTNPFNRFDPKLPTSVQVHRYSSLTYRNSRVRHYQRLPTNGPQTWRAATAKHPLVILAKERAEQVNGQWPVLLVILAIDGTKYTLEAAPHGPA